MLLASESSLFAGATLAQLPDELVMLIMQHSESVTDLVHFSMTSRAIRVLTMPFLNTIWILWAQARLQNLTAAAQPLSDLVSTVQAVLEENNSEAVEALRAQWHVVCKEQTGHAKAITSNFNMLQHLIDKQGDGVVLRESPLGRGRTSLQDNKHALHLHIQDICAEAMPARLLLDKSKNEFTSMLAETIGLISHSISRYQCGLDKIKDAIANFA